MMSAGTQEVHNRESRGVQTVGDLVELGREQVSIHVERLHAQLAGIQHARPTADVDLVVEVRAGSYALASGGVIDALPERRASR